MSIEEDKNDWTDAELIAHLGEELEEAQRKLDEITACFIGVELTLRIHRPEPCDELKEILEAKADE
jgi:hypothetical protein